MRPTFKSELLYLLPSIAAPWRCGAWSFYFQRPTGNMPWFMWRQPFGMGRGFFLSWRAGPVNVRWSAR